MTEPKWPFQLIGPIGSCVSFIAEEMKIGGLTKRGFTTLENSLSLLRLAAATFQRTHNQQGVRAVETLLAEQPYNEAWAREERESGFLTINRHLLVSMWGALEVAIEDTFVQVVLHDTSAVASLSAAGVSPPKGRSTPPTEVDARKYFDKTFKHDASATFSGRVVSTLAAVGVSVSLDPHVAETVNEVNAVRNALLHRGGIIDEFAVLQSPSLKPHEGKPFLVTEAWFMAAYSAISSLTNVLIVAVTTYVKARA